VIEKLKKIQGATTMTIQKKSLISSLNTTKKALAASTPVAGSASAGSVKPAVGKMAHAGMKAGTHQPKFARFAKLIK
jgi:hypothetical protein